MQPLYDNLGFIKRRFNIHGAENRLIEEMQKEQKLMISALAYIRGRSCRMFILLSMRLRILLPMK